MVQAGPPGSVQNSATSDPAMLPPDITVPLTGTNDLPTADVTTPTVPLLTCYADGSSDSMEILLAVAGGADQRFALVSLSGLAGKSKHRFLSSTNASPTQEQAQADSTWGQ